MNAYARLFFYLVSLLFLSPTLLANWAVNPSQLDNNTDSIRFYSNNNDKPALGMPFHTDRDLLGEDACVTFETHRTEGRKADFVTDKQWDLTELRAYFGFSVGASAAQKDLFSVSAEKRFSFDVSNTNYGESLTYHGWVELPDTYIEKGAFNDKGRRLANLGNPIGFKNACGNTFVSRIHRGAELFLQLNIKFNDFRAKAAFEKEVRGEVVHLLNVTKKIEAALEAHKSAGHVRIRGLQIGGDAEKLLGILNRDNGDGIPFANCNFDDLAECRKIINQLLAYTKDFTEQLSGDTAKAAALGFKTKSDGYASYTDDNTDPSRYRRVPLPVRKARQNLAEKYIEIADDIQTVNDLLIVVGDERGYRHGYRNDLLETKVILERNLDDVTEAGLECFEDIDNCVAISREVLDNLEPIDRNLLDARLHRDKITHIFEATYGSHRARCDMKEELTQRCVGESTCNIVLHRMMCGYDPDPGQHLVFVIKYKCEYAGYNEIIEDRNHAIIRANCEFG